MLPVIIVDGESKAMLPVIIVDGGEQGYASCNNC